MPIIALSATPQGDEGIWRNAGMDAYLTRPVRIDALEHLLSRWGTYPRRVEPVEGSHDATSVQDQFHVLARAMGGANNAASLLRTLLASTQTDIDILQDMQFTEIGTSLAAWLHTTVGALRSLGHSELTDWASRLEASLANGARLHQLAEMADLLVAVEDWVQAAEELLRQEDPSY